MNDNEPVADPILDLLAFVEAETEQQRARPLTKDARAALAAVNTFRQYAFGFGALPRDSGPGDPPRDWTATDRINVRDAAWMLINDAVKLLAQIGEGTDEDHLIRIIRDGLKERDT